MPLDKFKDAAAGAVDSAKNLLKDVEKTDAALDKAAEAANKATGDKHADKVAQARDFADDRIGDERK